MSKTITIQNNILEHLKENLDILRLKYFRMFLPKENAIEEKGKNESGYYPFLLIRPRKELKDGVFKKRIFEIIIGLEEENDDKAQENLFDIVEKVIEIIEKNSIVPGKFAINPATIVGDFNPEVCGEDFWGYTITFEADIPAVKSKILEEMDF
ncbi:hypothetical protein H3N56_02505 [Cetobacterium sp. 2A]|uniref:hypothetical protein n=1 Tax=Cetobacterium sp. 2A TaxID=2754723 RepID=UPI00163CA43C|nr:hypothetical protein [Cetobacterium sp. 2A]MBC2855364.1 hypothetical protein [Cetobacterium sp. 2A]